jgi:hypothetical protein
VGFSAGSDYVATLCEAVKFALRSGSDNGRPSTAGSPILGLGDLFLRGEASRAETLLCW